jgi:hypothetical protein
MAFDGVGGKVGGHAHFKFCKTFQAGVPLSGMCFTQAAKGAGK